TPISKRELLAYQADVKGSIFRQIRQMFARLKQQGFTQKDLATRIGMNEGQLSRRLRGDYDLRLETLSDLARGLDCRIDVKLEPFPGSAAAFATDQSIVAVADKYDEAMVSQMISNLVEERKFTAWSAQRRISKRRIYSRGRRSSPHSCEPEELSSLKTRFRDAGLKRGSPAHFEANRGVQWLEEKSLN